MIFSKKNLLSGCICPLKSLMESPVFFVKKKDGKLQFIQDYQKLNAIMVKNTYCYPSCWILSIRVQTQRLGTSQSWTYIGIQQCMN